MKNHVVSLLGALAIVLTGAVWAAPADGPGKQGHGNKGMQGKAAAEVRREGERVREEQHKRVGEAKGAGSDTSTQMRERREERKEIQQAHRDARQAGEGETVKGKKPWWKFWGSDDE